GGDRRGRRVVPGPAARLAPGLGRQRRRGDLEGDAGGPPLGPLGAAVVVADGRRQVVVAALAADEVVHLGAGNAADCPRAAARGEDDADERVPTLPQAVAGLGDLGDHLAQPPEGRVLEGPGGRRPRWLVRHAVLSLWPSGCQLPTTAREETVACCPAVQEASRRDDDDTVKTLKTTTGADCPPIGPFCSSAKFGNSPITSDFPGLSASSDHLSEWVSSASNLLRNSDLSRRKKPRFAQFYVVFREKTFSKMIPSAVSMPFENKTLASAKTRLAMLFSQWDPSIAVTLASSRRGHKTTAAGSRNKIRSSSKAGGSKLEHRGQRLTMMPETANLPAERGDVGAVGVQPCVEGVRIRQYTAAGGATMVYGVEAFECEGKLECVLRGRATWLHHEGFGRGGAHPLGMRRRGIFWPAVKVEFNGSISSKDTFDTIRTARMTWAGLTAGGGGTIPRTTGARRGGTARRKRARRSRDSSPEDGGGAGRPWAPPLGIRSRDEQGHSSYDAIDGSAVLHESVGALRRPAVGTLLLTTG
ncbi:hypothetical protein THAOC_16696, partial [Thalassiosira oceanica]